MKNKLMIVALLFCSSLSFAEGTAPAPEKKKPSKVIVAPSSTAQHPDDLGTGGLGSVGTSAPLKKVRATSAPSTQK